MRRRPRAARVGLGNHIIREEPHMSVAVVMNFKGGTPEQYDQVIERMGFEPGGAGASGGLFHWVTMTDDGIRVTDVWETADQFQQFADEQIAPITEEVGVPGPPEVTFYDVHNYLTAGPAA
jgi:hypothetical protein